MRNTDQQQGLDSKEKSSEDLKPEKKREMKEAAAELKEGIKKSGAGNQSVGTEVSNQATTQDIDNSKTMEH
ncbi:Predicted protein [Wolbachia endosymbiont strain TRS of Brugia malayi]|uniref:hypothetical protein n=1 Tax=Wolbachia endosymbiont of Brugia malayi TaxID=80849 RepID=UPI00004C943A|nr:hypothetical protein [Wolbachia endosymbiont of Brugia malayi]AAW71146.1 Predicted protein [Wolbachia endosymbiont strain TRS of Brugia malayi]